MQRTTTYLDEFKYEIQIRHSCSLKEFIVEVLFHLHEIFLFNFYFILFLSNQQLSNIAENFRFRVFKKQSSINI